MVLERKLPKAPRAAADKNQISPLRMILLGAVTLMALWVGWLLFAGPDQADAGDLATRPDQNVFAD